MLAFVSSSPPAAAPVTWTLSSEMTCATCNSWMVWACFVCFHLVPTPWHKLFLSNQRAFSLWHILFSLQLWPKSSSQGISKKHLKVEHSTFFPHPPNASQLYKRRAVSLQHQVWHCQACGMLLLLSVYSINDETLGDRNYALVTSVSLTSRTVSDIH